MNVSTYLRICMDQYEIMDMILRKLSATDSSSFIHALRMKLPPTIMNRYLHVLRDMPEYFYWIKSMVEDGNSVVFVGSDLERLAHRIMDPETYDRKNEVPICLWLVVKSTSVTTVVDGMRIRYTGLERLIHPYIEMTMRTLPSDRRDSIWKTSMTPNANNIKVVFFVNQVGMIRNNHPFIEPCRMINTNAVKCHLQIAGPKAEMWREWNVPLLKYTHDTKHPLMTMWYNVKQGTLEKSLSEDMTNSYPHASEEEIILFSDNADMQIRGSMRDVDMTVHYFRIPITNPSR